MMPTCPVSDKHNCSRVVQMLRYETNGDHACMGSELVND